MNKLNDKNILLLMSGYAAAGVGEQFTESMIKGHNPDSIVRYSTVNVATELVVDRFEYETSIYQVPFSAIPGLSTIKYWQFVKNDLKKCVKEVEQLINKNKLEMIWGILNSTKNILILSELIKTSEIPIVVHVWDVPEYLLKLRRQDFHTSKHLLFHFDRVMKHAKRGVMVSDRLCSRYKEKYGLESETMVFTAPIKSLPQSRVTDDALIRDITIVFAGGLYAYKPWEAMLDAVEKRNRDSSKPNIKVRCIARISRWHRKRNWVQYEALKPIEEAIKIVNSVDIAYLPYWMSKKHSLAVQTAFPSKLPFYTSGGTPILYHGPKNSTPTDFLEKYKVGISCHSKGSEDILSKIDELISTDFRSGYKKEQEKALQEVFDPVKMVEIFENALNSLNA